MNKLTTAISGFKYAYLIIFFALLAGFFHPLIRGGNSDNLIIGVLVLFVGLTGGILVFKYASSSKGRGIFLWSGFGLIALSLTIVFQMTGRF